MDLGPDDGIDGMAAELDATTSLLAALGITPTPPAQRPCGCWGCRKEIPPGRRRFCSDNCSAAVRMARWRARHGG